jgi:hypothetical protein
MDARWRAVGLADPQRGDAVAAEPSELVPGGQLVVAERRKRRFAETRQRGEALRS